MGRTRLELGLVPSIGGVLLFGREHEVHVPNAWIQAGRFKGADKPVRLRSASASTLCHADVASVCKAACKAFAALSVKTPTASARTGLP